MLWFFIGLLGLTALVAVTQFARNAYPRRIEPFCGICEAELLPDFSDCVNGCLRAHIDNCIEEHAQEQLYAMQCEAAIVYPGEEIENFADCADDDTGSWDIPDKIWQTFVYQNGKLVSLPYYDETREGARRTLRDLLAKPAVNAGYYLSPWTALTEEERMAPLYDTTYDGIPF